MPSITRGIQVSPAILVSFQIHVSFHPGRVFAVHGRLVYDLIVRVDVVQGVRVMGVHTEARLG